MPEPGLPALGVTWSKSISRPSVSLAKTVAPARGALMETFIVNELAKQATRSVAQVRLHHWRISGGAEVDVVLEREDGQIVGIESKARGTVTANDFQGLAALRDQVGDQFRQGIVLHTDKRGSVNYGERLLSLPIAALWEAGHR